MGSTNPSQREALERVNTDDKACTSGNVGARSDGDGRPPPSGVVQTTPPTAPIPRHFWTSACRGGTRWRQMGALLHPGRNVRAARDNRDFHVRGVPPARPEWNQRPGKTPCDPVLSGRADGTLRPLRSQVQVHVQRRVQRKVAGRTGRPTPRSLQPRLGKSRVPDMAAELSAAHTSGTLPTGLSHSAPPAAGPPWTPATITDRAGAADERLEACDTPRRNVSDPVRPGPPPGRPITSTHQPDGGRPGGPRGPARATPPKTGLYPGQDRYDPPA